MIKAIPIYISLFLLMLLTYTAGNSQTNKASNDMSITQTHRILTDKPVFLLEITKSGAPVKIDLNGLEVYNDTSSHQEFVTYPLNDRIASGENILDIYLVAPENLNYTLPEDMFIEINFLIKNNKDDEYLFDKINYQKNQKNPLLGSTESGNYSVSDRSFIQDDSGEITLGKIEVSTLDMIYNQKVGGVKLSQTIILKTPFPKWNYIDSENIIDKDYHEMSSDDVESFRQSSLIKELYEAYDEIHMSLKNKDIKSIIDLFDERTEEMDMAFYHPIGHTKNGFLKYLQDQVSEDVELLDIGHEKSRLVIEKNQKVAYLSKAITFKYNDGSGYSDYPIKFRRENGKWVITR